MFLKIVEKMLDDDVLLSKIQGLLKQYFVYIVPLLKTAGTERFNRNMRPAEVVDKYRALRPLRLRTEGGRFFSQARLHPFGAEPEFEIKEVYICQV